MADRVDRQLHLAISPSLAKIGGANLRQLRRAAQHARESILSNDKTGQYRRAIELPRGRPMEFQEITVTPSSPHIGAEIGNIDLTRPLSNRQVEELHAAFAKHLVIFFRDQKISHEDQIRLASHFGPLGKHVGGATISKTTDNPLVRKFHYDERSMQISGENWHSDQSCAEMPPLGSMLYNHTLPPDGGGDTMFASMYAAYDALSPRMKVYLEGMTAIHDGTRVFGPGTPIAVHPVVVRHPVTGKKLIYVNTDFTSQINDVPREEGERILQFLYDHCGRAEWTCRFRWTPHSIAFWDNRCAHHKAIWDYWPNVRSGFRVQIQGTVAPVAG
jgi:taurine dioxygenase